MNDLFASLGLEPWKAVISALVLPPVPLLVLMLVGARGLLLRRAYGVWLTFIAVLLLWGMCTTALGGALVDGLTKPPRALSASEIKDLHQAPKTAILVLGGGRRLLSPEYGVSNLTPYSIERLRYGLWLSRQTNLPVGFSGGVGHADPGGPAEADIAARIAEREFGRKLQWTETQSRDTSENAGRSVVLLKAAGITRIVLVTHGFHMRRAAAAFERAIAHHGGGIVLVTAPTGLSPTGLSPGGRLGFSDFLPTVNGFEQTRVALHEWLGYIAGA